VRVADGLKKSGLDADAGSEIVALIAYLQRLGTDIKTPVAAHAGGGR